MKTVWVPLDLRTKSKKSLKKPNGVPDLVYVQPDDTVQSSRVYSEYSLSRIIVAQGDLPFTAEIKGTIDESTYKLGPSRGILEYEMLRSNGPSNEFRWVW